MNAMTPQGVEHALAINKIANPSGVMNAMTPQGVEHRDTSSREVRIRAKINYRFTPLHADGCRSSIRHETCASLSDAIPSP